MNQAILTGKTGVRGQQARLDTIGYNLSNANTIGYKGVRVDFKDALYQTLRRPVQPQDELNLELGHGVLVGRTHRFFLEGSQQLTGNPLDIAIANKEGMFSLLTQEGTIEYSRNGAFYLSNEADGEFIVDGQGRYLLNTEGQRIALDGQKASSLSISEDGVMSYGTEAPFGKIAVFTFESYTGLEALGDSNFTPTDASGPPRLVAPGTVPLKQGAVEMSNVDMANEMARMIRTQRAMQLSSRAITTADQMMGIANSIRR